MIDLLEQFVTALRWVVGGFVVLVFSFLLVYSVAFAFHAGRRAGMGHKPLSEKDSNGEN